MVRVREQNLSHTITIHKLKNNNIQATHIEHLSEDELKNNNNKLSL